MKGEEEKIVQIEYIEQQFMKRTINSRRKWFQGNKRSSRNATQREKSQTKTTKPKNKTRIKSIWYIWNMDNGYGYVDTVNRMLNVRNAYASIVFLLSCGRIESPDLLESNAARFSLNRFFSFSFPLFHYDATVVCCRRRENPSGTCRSLSTYFFNAQNIFQGLPHTGQTKYSWYIWSNFCVCSFCYSRIQSNFFCCDRQ